VKKDRISPPFQVAQITHFERFTIRDPGPPKAPLLYPANRHAPTPPNMHPLKGNIMNTTTTASSPTGSVFILLLALVSAIFLFLVQ
jgi:hypothetical protein